MNSRSVLEPFVDVTDFERSIASSRPGLLKEPVEKKKIKVRVARVRQGRGGWLGIGEGWASRV